MKPIIETDRLVLVGPEDTGWGRDYAIFTSIIIAGSPKRTFVDRIGQISIFDERSPAGYEIFDYEIKNDFRCRGYATEAVKAILSICPNGISLTMRIHEDNTASQKVASKCSFTKKRVLELHGLPPMGEWVYQK